MTSYSITRLQVVVISFTEWGGCIVLLCTAGDITLIYHAVGCCPLLFCSSLVCCTAIYHRWIIIVVPYYRLLYSPFLYQMTVLYLYALQVTSHWYTMLQVVEISFSVSCDCTVLLCPAGDITVMLQVVVLSFSVALYCTVLHCRWTHIVVPYCRLLYSPFL